MLDRIRLKAACRLIRISSRHTLPIHSQLRDIRKNGPADPPPIYTSPGAKQPSTGDVELPLRHRQSGAAETGSRGRSYN
jgi:hypothetical protein